MPKQTKSRAGVASRLAIDTPTPAMLAPTAIKVADKRLTKKQREFAQAIVDGETGAGAYRKAYAPKGKPEHHARRAVELKSNSKVAATIEALKRAKELSESLSAAQIRALILSDLLKHSQDEEQKLSDRLNALKLLGTLSDVAAYTERKEVLNIKASVDIKQQLMEKLKLIGAGSTDSPKPKADSDDAASLMNELRSDPNVIDGELIEQGADFPQPDSEKP